MGKGRKHRRRGGFDPDMYWESAAYNSTLFQMFRNQITKLAMSRFKWLNLPKSCDERFLEQTLLYEGLATISFPKRQPGEFYSTKVAQMSPPNLYDNPTRWISIGNNGWRFRCNCNNGTIVWDNKTRYPLMQFIDMWAMELTDIRRTKQINRLHVKTPFVIECEPEQEQQAVNLFKQISGGEPAIINTNSLSNGLNVNVINTGVKFLGEELSTEELNTWQQVYQGLGITNLTYKAERMVQDEVDKRDEPSELITLDGIDCRRTAARYLNQHFGKYLEAPIEVVWAKDLISANYNFLHNAEEQAEVDNGEDISDE